MGIRHNGRFSEDISHDEIGALPSHTRQVQKSVKIVRHPAAVFIPQYLHTGADIPGLTLSQSTRPYNFLDLIHRSLRHRIDIRVFFIEILYHHIDPGVCALRRQPYTNKQLPRLVIVKRTVRIRVLIP